MKAECRLPAAYQRVVMDTNVIISAALSPTGAPAHVLKRLLKEGRLAFSDATYSELETRLWRPKFDPHLTAEERKLLLRTLSSLALWVEPASPDTYSRDPDDDKFIHVALAAKATRLISGDADLLDLDPLGDLRIVTPRAALDALNTLTHPD